MATGLARLQGILNNVVDGTATPAQMTAVGNAFTAQASDIDIFNAFGISRASLTQNQIALIAVTSITRSIRATLRVSAETAQRVIEDANVTAAGDAAEGGL